MKIRKDNNKYDGNSGSSQAAISELTYRQGREYYPNTFVRDANGEKFYLDHTIWDKYY